MSSPMKAASFSAIHVIAASAVYYHLITGGWLMTHYSLDDLNVVNLILATVEPIAILGVIAYWIWRTPFLYRLLVILCLAQLLIAIGFATFFLVFIISWHPKMM
jgi:hypothetical protein